MINWFLRWSGCATIVAGSIANSFDLAWNKPMFIAAAIIYLIWGIRIKDNSFIVLNAIGLLIYAAGYLK